MRLIVLLALLLPSMALAQVTIGPGAHTGPRILGEASTEYCPMLTNGKCTDGKTITTTRSTPVPCGSGTAGVDVGCYDGGQEVHGQVTNNWVRSTDFLGWVNSGNAADVPVNSGGVWRFTVRTSGTYRDSSRSHSGLAGEVWIASCEMRSEAGATVRIEPTTGTFSPERILTSQWHRYSSSAVTLAANGSVRPYFYGIKVGESFEVRQCQLVKGSDPGRRCDAGATPATCDSDKPLVSALGFPTTQGDLSLRFRLSSGTGSRSLIDGRTAGDTARTLLQIDSLGRLRLDAVAGGGSVTVPGPYELGRWYAVRLAVRSGRVDVYVDGLLQASLDGALSWGSVAHLGVKHTATDPLNGTISRLEWSNQ